MIRLILILFFLAIFYILKNKISLFKKNKKLQNFKNKFTSKEFQIEKIYSRYDEKLASDPNINIKIGIYDKQQDIINKTNIHRSRLAKFQKSKLNGEYIYIDFKNRIYKEEKGNKIYL